uniref:Uncharacterized protein n=1 Tax=Rhizophora mucronata TaxID=61149 RepID=A0A2P2PJT4_RHIMU
MWVEYYLRMKIDFPGSIVILDSVKIIYLFSCLPLLNKVQRNWM